MSIPAEEVTSNSDSHILVYGLLKEIPKGLSTEQIIYRAHAQNALAIIAHPFDVLHPYRDTYDLPFDGIEQYNSAVLSRKKTEKLCKKLHSQYPHLILTAGSDAHGIRGMGFGTMYFPFKRKTWQEYMEDLRKYMGVPYIRINRIAPFFYGGIDILTSVPSMIKKSINKKVMEK